MVGGYAIHGNNEDSIKLFDLIKHIETKHNNTIFVLQMMQETFEKMHDANTIYVLILTKIIFFHPIPFEVIYEFFLLKLFIEILNNYHY